MNTYYPIFAGVIPFLQQAGYPCSQVKYLFLVLVLAVAIAGPVPASPAAAGTAPHPVSRAGLSDAQIERNIRAKLAKSKINADHFTVKVSGGVAMLDGKTGIIQHKGVATRLAKTGGAIAVQNHIQISEEAKAKAAARLAKYREGGTMAKATVLPPSAAKPK